MIFISVAKLTDHYLLSAAQNMEESIVPAGTVLIKQDDVGDSVCRNLIHLFFFFSCWDLLSVCQFYVVEEGQVSVTVYLSSNSHVVCFLIMFSEESQCK